MLATMARDVRQDPAAPGDHGGIRSPSPNPLHAAAAVSRNNTQSPPLKARVGIRKVPPDVAQARKHPSTASVIV